MGIRSAIRRGCETGDAPKVILGAGGLTILLSSVRRTAMPASTLPTVRETSMVVVVVVDNF
jgi:hypothetical protein